MAPGTSGTAPAPATPTTPSSAAPTLTAPPTGAGGGAAGGGFDPGFTGGQFAALGGGGLAIADSGLNMLGDQGTIVIGPGRGGDDVSVIRNFALNVTDNNTATLQNRLIPIEYHHFFKANRVYPGLPTGSNRYLSQVRASQFSSTRVQTNDDRYVFGFEYVLAERLSVLVRQAVVTINQPTVDLQRGVDVMNLGGSHSGWGDLQISPKYRVYSKVIGLCL